MWKCNRLCKTQRSWCSMGRAILYMRKLSRNIVDLLFLWELPPKTRVPKAREYWHNDGIPKFKKRFVCLKCQRFCFQIYPKSRTKQKSLTNGKTGFRAELLFFFLFPFFPCPTGIRTAIEISQLPFSIFRKFFLAASSLQSSLSALFQLLGKLLPTCKSKSLVMNPGFLATLLWLIHGIFTCLFWPLDSFSSCTSVFLELFSPI